MNNLFRRYCDRRLNFSFFRNPFCEQYLTRARLIEQFDEYNKKMNSYLSVSSELSNTLLEVREAFHDNHLITAEECAKQMQERAEIYLNE